MGMIKIGSFIHKKISQKAALSKLNNYCQAAWKYDAKKKDTTCGFYHYRNTSQITWYKLHFIVQN